MTGSSGLSPAEVQVAEARLSAAWGERARILGAEAIQGRTDVFRLRLDGGRSAVLKRRGGGREVGRHGGEAAGFGIELATLEYLNAMPAAVAPRLLGADTEAGIMLMEDLGPGPSLADSLLTGEAGQAKADLIAYGRALGRLHAWSRSRGDELAALRARYAPGAALEPSWMGAIERGREAFLGVAAGLGLATDGVGDEISGLGALMSGSGRGGTSFLGLVHGDLCPDNVRLVGGDGRIFDFETSGWGPVVLDVAYLLAPFPSCWCFGAVPADVAGAALDAYRAEAGTGRANDLGPDRDAAMAAAVASWVIARGPAMATALDEDRRWGTTSMRPRLLAWLRSFTRAAGQADVLPRLRDLARELDAELSSRWPQAQVPDFPALARPAAPLVQGPGWWRPEG